MKKGVLLINLGTPDNPGTMAVRKYLTQFLNDRRVIDISAIGRFFLVNFIIVPFRSPKSAKLYKSIWSKDGSPLLKHGIDLKNKLQNKLGDSFVVAIGMRYQNPSIYSALEELRKESVEEIIVIPLYPQYASSSTGSSVEEFMRILQKWEVTPNIKIIDKFYDQSSFVQSWVNKVKNININQYDHIVFSYHGLPERQIKKAGIHYGESVCSLGDCCNSITQRNQYCYRAACFHTTRELVKALNIPEGKYTSSFQSRLDDGWLKPYSDKIMAELPKKGAKKILVFSPAFVADCLETIYEIGHEYKEIFMQHGGEKFDWVESLNSEEYWVDSLKELVHK
jgi:ferrochelatase